MGVDKGDSPARSSWVTFQWWQSRVLGALAWGLLRGCVAPSEPGRHIVGSGCGASPVQPPLCVSPGPALSPLFLRRPLRYAVAVGLAPLSSGC